MHAQLEKRAAAFAAFAQRFGTPVENSVAAYLRLQSCADLLFDFLAQLVREPPPTFRHDTPLASEKTCRFALWFRGATADLDVAYCCEPLLDSCGCDKCDGPPTIENACVLLAAVLGNFVVDGAVRPRLEQFVARVKSVVLSVNALRDCDSESHDEWLDTTNRNLAEIRTAGFGVFHELCSQPRFRDGSQTLVDRGLGSLEIYPEHRALADGEPFALVLAPADEAAELERRRRAKRAKHNQ